jgi:hypothetical protein
LQSIQFHYSQNTLLRSVASTLVPVLQPGGLTKNSRSVERSDTTGKRFIKIQSDSGGVAHHFASALKSEILKPQIPQAAAWRP